MESKFATLLLLIIAVTSQLPAIEGGVAILATSSDSTDSLRPLQTSALFREARSGYSSSRYGTGSGSRGFLERLTQYERQPTKCARCLDDRYAEDRDGDYDRDRYRDNDHGRPSHRPTYGSRYDRNEEEDDNRGGKRNGTDGSEDDRERKPDRRPGNDERRYPYDDKRDRYDRNRYDNRGEYYDRFLPRDPYVSDDGYRRGQDRDRYEDDVYGGRRYGSDGDRRRPQYDAGYDNYDRAYEDRSYGRDRYHDSFRPWDETYRGSSGFDDEGRGYYFASGRPDAGASSGWTRPDTARPDLGYGSYARPEKHGRPGTSSDSYDRLDPYARPDAYGRPGDAYGRPGNAYRQPSDVYGRPGDAYERPGDAYGSLGHAYGRPGSSYGHPGDGYGRPTALEGYGRPSADGWHDVGERRPPVGWHSAGSGWRDQSSQSGGGRPGGGGGGGAGGVQDYGSSGSDRTGTGYGPMGSYGLSGSYGTSGSHGQTGSSTNGYGHTSTATTPGNSYLYEREGDATVKTASTRDDTTTKPPS